MNTKKFFLFIFFFISTFTNDNRTGKIIAVCGLSGSGKSTLTKLLASEFNADYLCEPEEVDWPLALKKRGTYGAGQALLSLRHLWIEQFLQADKKRCEGKFVFIDTYFLKIVPYYLSLPGMEWLVPSNDPYFSVLKELFEIDQHIIPDVNGVILLDVDYEDWHLFLKSRGRNWDKDPDFLKSYQITKKYIFDATVEHCNNQEIPIINFHHRFGNLNQQVEKLKKRVAQELN